MNKTILALAMSGVMSAVLAGGAMAQGAAAPAKAAKPAAAKSGAAKAAPAGKGSGKMVAGFPRVGGHPDFSGVWSAVDNANWNIEPHAASAGLQIDSLGRTSPGSSTAAPFPGLCSVAKIRPARSPSMCKAR
jgi:hypothetical protein